MVEIQYRELSLVLSNTQLAALVEAIAWRQELLRNRIHDPRLERGLRLRALNESRALANAQREILREAT